jgi:SAM-dependent methyltransferase
MECGYPIGAAVIRDKYRGRTAEIYDQRSGSPKWHAEEAAMERFLGAIGPGANVLDVPVGTGRFLAAYRRHGMTAIGMDVSEDMMAQARLKVPDADLRVGNILDIGLPAKSVDVAVAVRILSWLTIDEMKVALAELSAVARTWIITGGGRHADRQSLYRSVPGFRVVEEALIDRNARGDYELVLLRRE